MKGNFNSEVSKILADLMHFKRWTGVLQVQPCFEIIEDYIFGMLYLSLNSIVFVTACDIHGFLTSVVVFNFMKMPLKSLST